MRVPTIMLATALLATPALAQGDPADPRAIAPPPERCRVEPAQPGAETDVAPTQESEASASLTEKLDDCDGVLKPPAVGDGEIAEPPPSEGKTLTIKPEDLPAQQ